VSEVVLSPSGQVMTFNYLENPRCILPVCPGLQEILVAFQKVPWNDLFP
jgi:hypothetical protein